MKKFIYLVLNLILITFVLAVVLDLLYSGIYNTNNHRGKIDFAYSSKAQNYDVIILGSSRANNHFVSDIFHQKGLKTFNFGLSGGHLFEASLLLKLMIFNKCKIKNVILESDLNLAVDYRADGIAARFLPYLVQSKVIRSHFENDVDFKYLGFIPFYRYMKFESKIGVRELFFSAINKKTNHLQNLGYSALMGNQNGNMKNNLKSLNPLPANKYYLEIKRICQENNIRFIPISTPMCENVIGIDYFQKVKTAYPEIHNYENAVIKNENFSSCGHLNDVGARKFTKIIITDFFTNKK